MSCFRLISDDDKQDHLINATELLNKRLLQLEKEGKPAKIEKVSWHDVENKILPYPCDFGKTKTVWLPQSGDFYQNIHIKLPEIYKDDLSKIITFKEPNEKNKFW